MDHKAANYGGCKDHQRHVEAPPAYLLPRPGPNARYGSNHSALGRMRATRRCGNPLLTIAAAVPNLPVPRYGSGDGACPCFSCYYQAIIFSLSNIAPDQPVLKVANKTPHASISLREKLHTRESAVSLLITLGGLLDYLIRQRRRGRLLVPSMGYQPVPHELFIKVGLVLARSVSLRVPERLESGVKISSMSINSPSTNPNSSLVSARIIPCRAA